MVFYRGGPGGPLSNLCQEGTALRKKIDDAKRALRPFVSDNLVIQNNTQSTLARTSTWTEPPQLSTAKWRQKRPWWKQIHTT
jgi:hypothetical protein